MTQSQLSRATIRSEIWNKGQVIFGVSSDQWRRDNYGNPIKFRDYGNRESPYGWEIHHIIPKRFGGMDVIGNLRPLHCRAPRLAGQYKCTFEHPFDSAADQQPGT